MDMKKVVISDAKLKQMIKESVSNVLNEVNRYDSSFYGGDEGDIQYFNRETNFDGTDFLDPDNYDVANSVYKIHCEINDLLERLGDYGRYVKKEGATDVQLGKLRKLYVLVNRMHKCSREVLEMYNGGLYCDCGDNAIPQSNYGNWYSHMGIDPD